MRKTTAKGILTATRKRVILALAFSVLLLSSCSMEPQLLRWGGNTQGTTYSILCISDKYSVGYLSRKVSGILEEIDNSMSVYNNSSVISRINRNETDKPDRYLEEVIGLSQKVSEMTGGAFDITVGPLVRAWGFGPEENRKFDTSKLDSLMNLVGYKKIRVEKGLLVRDNPGIIIDVNAIAQGYTADVIGRFFDSLGIENYLVEVGGEVKSSGTKSGKPWRIGIDKPFDNNMKPGENLQAVIELSGEGLATSGNYRKFYEVDGVKYSHTINPVTGYPARNRLLSATIIAGESAIADAVATACMVMGLEKSIEFISNHPEFEAYFVFSGDSGDFETWESEKMKRRISGE